MARSLQSFKEIWSVDFEYQKPPGFLPEPVCVVAREFKTGREIRVWRDELLRMKAPPYPLTEDILVVAYFSSAEINCHIALGWPRPKNLLDLYVEFKCLTNGKYLPLGRSLFGAMSFFGLDGIDATEKDSMRDLIIRGGPWSTNEREAILNYCQGDVLALEKLLLVIAHHIDLDQALLRGRYMSALSQIESNGIPIDVVMYEKIFELWEKLQFELINVVDHDYYVFQNGSFSELRFADYLNRSNIKWPTLATGRLRLDEETFKTMAIRHPQVRRLCDLRSTLQKMRKFELALGPDGRNRCLISPFSTSTGRNQTGGREGQFVFNLPKWFRHLIKPSAGNGLAYIDWSQQEFGIAGALSKCKSMQEAYQSGDSYLGFATQAGAVSISDPIEIQKVVRGQYKSTALATLYGGGAGLIEFNTGLSSARAKDLLRNHKSLYSDFWKWSEAISNTCFMQNQIETVFGWKLRIDGNEDVNPRSVINFPMQANGAEILRLACIGLVEAGIKVCAPVHDALLIEAPLDKLDAHIDRAELIMKAASAAVLNGFRLRTTKEVVSYPNRFQPESGTEMWNLIQNLIQKIEGELSSGGH